MSDDDDDRSLRERIGDAAEHLGDKLRGHDDEDDEIPHHVRRENRNAPVDPEVKVHRIESVGEWLDEGTNADRVHEDERDEEVG